jgi:dethiobiotin synthetase
MAIVVVGGHTRNIGKTSVVAGLVRALPEMRWTAFKITQFGHGVCSANGEPCDQ